MKTLRTLLTAMLFLAGFALSYLIDSQGVSVTPAAKYAVVEEMKDCSTCALIIVGFAAPEPVLTPKEISGKMILTIVVVRPAMAVTAVVVNTTVATIDDGTCPDCSQIIEPEPTDCVDCGHQEWGEAGPHPAPLEGCGEQYAYGHGPVGPTPQPAHNNKP